MAAEVVQVMRCMVCEARLVSGHSAICGPCMSEARVPAPRGVRPCVRSEVHGAAEVGANGVCPACGF